VGYASSVPRHGRQATIDNIQRENSKGNDKYAAPPLQVLSRSITRAQLKFDTPMALASPSACTSSIALHVSLHSIVLSMQHAHRVSAAPYRHIGKHLPVRHGSAFLERPLGRVSLFKRHEADVKVRSGAGEIGGRERRGQREGGGRGCSAREGNGEVDEEEVDVFELQEKRRRAAHINKH
jgi:hypothetical protein